MMGNHPNKTCQIKCSKGHSENSLIWCEFGCPLLNNQDVLKALFHRELELREIIKNNVQYQQQHKHNLLEYIHFQVAKEFGYINLQKGVDEIRASIASNQKR